MHKNATKCNETLSKWYKNKHGASKIIDTFETYHMSTQLESAYLAELGKCGQRVLDRRHHFLGERHTLQNHHGFAGSGTFYSTLMSYRGGGGRIRRRTNKKMMMMMKKNSSQYPDEPSLD
jgi:hypothetical protein